MATAPVCLSKELTMSDRILVMGATGLQGGAVARHLLKLGKPEVRCLTRRPDSEAAKTLKQLGAEVVRADLDDPASLKSALRDCTGVFGVTDFWEAFLREYDQGVNLIDAAFEAGVGHLVLRTLPSAAKIRNGAIANIWVLPMRQHGSLRQNSEKVPSFVFWLPLSGQCQSLPYGLPAVACPPKSAFLSGTWRRLSRSVPSLTRDPANLCARMLGHRGH